MGDDTYFDELGEIMNNWTSFSPFFIVFPLKFLYSPLKLLEEGKLFSNIAPEACIPYQHYISCNNIISHTNIIDSLVTVSRASAPSFFSSEFSEPESGFSVPPGMDFSELQTFSSGKSAPGKQWWP